MIFGGLGRDSLTVSKERGVANGGLGNDRIVLKQKGVGIGGAGADVIRSATADRTLLIGGAGRDRFIAAGAARVDARDGERDVVICHGTRVQVKADRQDLLRGACEKV